MYYSKNVEKSRIGIRTGRFIKAIAFVAEKLLVSAYGSYKARGFLYFRKILFESFCHWQWCPTGKTAGSQKFCVHAVNARCFTMKIIITQLIPDYHKYDQAAGNTQSQASNVDQGIRFVMRQIPQACF